MDDAISTYPYLIRKIEGKVRLGKKTWGYSFRPVDVDRLEQILSDAAAASESDAHSVFGTWALWPGDWAGADGAQRADADRDEDGRLVEPWYSDAAHVVEAVDISALRRYASQQQDRRIGQLADLISQHETNVENIVAGVSYLRRAYLKKNINGRPLGRRYTRGPPSKA